MLFIKAYIIQKGKEENLNFPIFDIDDIWITLNCDKDNSYPEKFKLIVIYYPYVTDQWIEVVPDVLRKDYINNVSKGYGVPSLQEEDQNLRNGIIWAIADYKQYFFWRNVLRDFFSNDSKVREIIDKYTSPNQKDQTVDYFVHLVMLAAFDSLVK